MHHSVPTASSAPLARSLRRAPSRRTGVLGALLALTVASAVLLGAPGRAEAAGPSWDAVLAARGDEAATKQSLAQIQTALDAASTRASQAQAAADEAGKLLGEAQAAVDLATGEHAALQQKSDEAKASAESARKIVGQAAVLLARPSSGGLTGDLLAAGDDAENLLRGLSMSSKLGENIGALRERAVVADNLATSLANQASVALAQRDKLAKEAETALADASAASETAANDLAAVDEERATLAAQAAALTDQRLSLEGAYAQAQAEAAAKAAAERAAAQAAAAAAAAAKPKPPVGGGGGTSPVGPGPGTSVPDPGTGWVTAIRNYSTYQAYGMRWHPIYGDWRLHAGADFGATCGTPIFSVSAGKVTYAGPSSGYGNLIVVDHGGGISSAYGHMETSGIYVRTGQQVSAGQNIAGVGTAGGSTGCHLHLEVRKNSVPTDPVAFLATKGVR
ncbi:peptidoglycan DD-metalloendopeptidase family protein [Frigoribacterium sp. 2-23]|uniref:peptidoglycan DD-metalloendopeptidase family protein n=1 Tax=Frigoribacterium sp. 2-23 TaxID=3415006 RepID=UPI003C6F61AE